MKKQILAVTLLAMLVLAVAGCQTGAKGPSDEELVKSATDTFIKGLVAKNPDAAIAVVSPDFSHVDAGDREGLRRFIADAIDSGYLDDAEADFSGAEYTLEADKARAYPIVINSAAGSATMGVELAKKDSAWMIIGIEIEGI